MKKTMIKYFLILFLSQSMYYLEAAQQATHQELTQQLLEEIRVWDNDQPADDIKALLQAGADVNGRWLKKVKGKRKIAVLHEAVGRSYFGTELLKIILKEKNVDVDIRDIKGNTPLIFAGLFAVNKPEIVALLANAGANVNAQNNNGNTALHLFASYAIFFREMVEALLQAGANPYLKNKKGKTIFDLVSTQFKDVLQELVDEVNEKKQCPSCLMDICKHHEQEPMLHVYFKHPFHKACLKRLQSKKIRIILECIE